MPYRSRSSVVDLVTQFPGCAILQFCSSAAYFVSKRGLPYFPLHSSFIQIGYQVLPCFSYCEVSLRSCITFENLYKVLYPTYLEHESIMMGTDEYENCVDILVLYCPTKIVFLKLLTDVMIFSNKVMLHYLRLFSNLCKIIQ